MFIKTLILVEDGVFVNGDELKSTIQDLFFFYHPFWQGELLIFKLELLCLAHVYGIISKERKCLFILYVQEYIFLRLKTNKQTNKQTNKKHLSMSLSLEGKNCRLGLENVIPNPLNDIERAIMDDQSPDPWHPNTVILEANQEQIRAAFGWETNNENVRRLSHRLQYIHCLFFSLKLLRLSECPVLMFKVSEEGICYISMSIYAKQCTLRLAFKSQIQRC